MNVKRPTDFPSKGAIDGSEEIYTQTNGQNYKFTVDDVANLTLQGMDEWRYKEVVPTSIEWSDCETNPIQLLDESLLAPNEFYEIYRIVCEVIVGVLPGDDKTPINILYKQNSGTVYNTSDSIATISSNFFTSTVNAVTIYHMESTLALVKKQYGVYIQSAVSALSKDSTYTFKIYYRISS